MDPTYLTYESAVSKLGSDIGDNNFLSNRRCEGSTVAMCDDEDVCHYVDIKPNVRVHAPVAEYNKSRGLVAG
ncbi:hypothetical protein ACTXT7_001305 [Hymenolepis weldensis]